MIVLWAWGSKLYGCVGACSAEPMCGGGQGQACCDHRGAAVAVEAAVRPEPVELGRLVVRLQARGGAAVQGTGRRRYVLQSQ